MTANGSRVIRVNGGEPQNGLVPTNTIEGYGNRIVDLLFTGLYDYGVDGGLRPAMVDTLRTEDNRNYTITIRKDWTFTDGTPVTASSYVDAWNFGALSTNGQLQRSFFSPIEGYDAVAAETPRARTMSGLKVEDDHTFTVRLKQANIDFMLSLGFTPFKPLPRVFFEAGVRKFGEHPVGNGPYRLAGEAAWQHDVQLDLVPNADYRGPDRPRNDGISVVFYRSLEDAYRDLLAGRLDVLDSVPDSELTSYHRDLGNRAIDQPIALNKALAIPYDLPNFGGAEGRLRRAAISRAIDRPYITEQVFHSTKRPAVDFTARTLPGFDADLPGNDVLRFDAAVAKSLWAEAEAIAPWRGPFEITYNEDGGHDLWIDALAEQVGGTLGIEVTTTTFPTFKQVRDGIANRTITSAFRTGWRGDYPSLIGFLEPLFAKGAGANEVGYHSTQFEARLAEAKQAVDVETSHRLTKAAQAVLLRDLPVIPLWDYINAGGRGRGVSVQFKWNGLPDYPNITKS
ncbi:ABC transporter substrate-binding protein [Kitasatospora sp. GP82]|uniref:peptide ABC transporter substrate-binding protein n=1 Tax=Kitasatospora sp. GP82 TaxID=3035089 RepID=UPI002473705F|nr:ABC transporter substrate-binding protein [Kitasatospora sp. GP82]MDH6123907.1 oligopeptide transport system substrate-binding protein [Kitasatospora sp. GP82]